MKINISTDRGKQRKEFEEKMDKYEDGIISESDLIKHINRTSTVLSEILYEKSQPDIIKKSKKGLQS